MCNPSLCIGQEDFSWPMTEHSRDTKTQSCEIWHSYDCTSAQGFTDGIDGHSWDSLGHIYQDFSPLLGRRVIIPHFPHHSPSETLSILFWSWCLLYEGVACRHYSTVLSELELLGLSTYRSYPAYFLRHFCTRQGFHQYFSNTPNYGMCLGAINLAIDFA